MPATRDPGRTAEHAGHEDADDCPPRPHQTVVLGGMPERERPVRDGVPVREHGLDDQEPAEVTDRRGGSGQATEDQSHRDGDRRRNGDGGKRRGQEREVRAG